MLRVIRSGYALLLSLNVLLLLVDRHLLFGPDSFLPPGIAPKVVDPDTINLYDVLPSSPWTISLSLASLLGAAGALVLEVRPRLAALYIFVLLGWIHHANMLLFDAEDVVFRLFAFFLIFAPPGKKMTPPQSGHSNTTEHVSDPAWPIRLFQLQICLIYFCSALQKSNGDEWLDGSAVYYSLRLDDMTRFQLPFGLGDGFSFHLDVDVGDDAARIRIPLGRMDQVGASRYFANRLRFSPRYRLLPQPASLPLDHDAGAAIIRRLP